MARKGWDSLSAGYKARLGRAGITEKEYSGGQSIAKARGHEKTPENPRNYDPGKYGVYHQKREELTAKIEERRVGLWGDRPGYSAHQADRNIRSKPPSVKDMRRLLAMTDEEILDDLSEDADTYKWFGYH